MAKGNKLDRFRERLEDLDPETRRSYLERLYRDLGLFDTIINAIDEGVMVIDRNLAVKYYNARAKAMLGLPENAAEIPMSRLLPDLDWRRIMPFGDEGWSSSNQEFETHYPEHGFFQASIRPMNGDNTQAVVVIRDVTNDRDREKEAHVRGWENSALRFGAVVAHEVRNPLHGIYLMLQLMEKERGKELVSDLKKCGNEVLRLTNMLTNLMDTARPDGNKDFVPVDLATLVREVAVSLEPESRVREIAVEVLQPKPVPPVPGAAG
ncbi:MAG: PAS domain-containing protein, partial [Victivallaceae bacterium]|nr:PAS domain-containing protein [Victivallaceae bacterium]